VRQRGRDYLEPGLRDDTDLKPPPASPDAPRAWLISLRDEHDAHRAGDPHGGAEEEPAPDRWRMLLENTDAAEPNHEGAFGELVALASQHRVVSYFVWSPLRRTYDRLSAEAVSGGSPPTATTPDT
jgi:hypothetical protein